MGRNGKSLMGIPWEWQFVIKLGMGMGRNGNRLDGNGRECECKKPFPGISSLLFVCGRPRVAADSRSVIRRVCCQPSVTFGDIADVLTFELEHNSSTLNSTIDYPGFRVEFGVFELLIRTNKMR